MRWEVTAWKGETPHVAIFDAVNLGAATCYVTCWLNELGIEDADALELAPEAPPSDLWHDHWRIPSESELRATMKGGPWIV